MGDTRGGRGCDVIALSGFNRCSWSGPNPSLISARESGTTLLCQPLSAWKRHHRSLRLGIPNPGGGAVQIMFANQRFLNFAGARGIDLLLAALLAAFLRDFMLLREVEWELKCGHCLQSGL